MDKDFAIVITDVDEDVLDQIGRQLLEHKHDDEIVFRVRSEIFEDMTNLDSVLKGRMLHAFMTSNSFPDHDVFVHDSGQERTLRADGHWRPDGWRFYTLTRKRNPELEIMPNLLPPAPSNRLPSGE